MTRKALTLAVAALLLWPAAAWAQVQAVSPPNTRFFSSLSDVPLMRGLSEVPARDADFDKPEGRIVETSAVAGKGIEGTAIAAFYDTVLPQLGWTRTGEGVFIRQNEILTLKIGHENGFAVARFLVAPR